MVLRTGSFAEMAEDIINNHSKIVVFGTGVIGLTTTPELLRQHNLMDRVMGYIDNNGAKWGDDIEIYGKRITVFSPNILMNTHEKIVVILAISRYQEVLVQLEGIDELKDVSCYIIPELCVGSFHNDGGKGVIRDTKEQVIPKTIHYMWFGGKEIPEKLQYCIDSWRKFCPDYEIIRWDETNYDVHKNSFVAQAYDNGKYGFIPDYARLELLYEYGGIYLDTDVELIRNIDELLYQEAFCSVEKWQVINFGGCSGAAKGHPSLIPFIEKWKNRCLINKDGSIDNISSGLIDTKIAIEAGYKINGKIQSINGMNIYTYDYFHPYDYMTKKLEITDDTFSIHHFNGGWI